MNCPNCGYLNAEGATACASCGQALVAAPAAPPAAPPAYTPPPAPPAAPPAYAPPAAPPAYAPPPQGYAPQPQGYAQQPPAGAAVPLKNHMVMAILSTIFCCWPAGLVGIIMAAQVNSKLQQGDYAGAQKASKAAATWSWVAIIAGALIIILYGALVAFGIVADQSGSLSSY